MGELGERVQQVGTLNRLNLFDAVLRSMNSTCFDLVL